MSYSNGYLGGYSVLEAEALASFPRTVSFRYDLLDGFGGFKSTLSGVLAGSIAYDSFAEIKRTARFDVDESDSINWLSDQIKPYMVVDGNEWALGVFLLTSPTRRTDGTTVLRSVEAYDRLVVLRDDRIVDRLVIAVGAVVTDAVVDLLEGAGISSSTVEVSTATLPAAMEWEPGTSKLEIVNDLLRAINYQTLWFDADGTAQVQSYLFPLARPVAHTYKTDEDSIVVPSASNTLDLFGVPNRWVAYTETPDAVALRAEKVNENPDSPTSTISRLRTIAKVERVEAVDQATLDALLERIAIEDSQVYEDVEIQTALMPEHGDSDLIEVEHSGLGLSDLFIETGWDMELRAGTFMRHSLRRVVTI